MEFSRRGPATAGAAERHRRPDPPPHGDAMLVMRDALLWQLHKDRLRQEIIVAELAKIERAMALHAAPSNQTMSMPRGSMAQRRESMFGWEPEHYCDLGEEHDVKPPNNDGRQSAESRFWKPVAEDRPDECWNPNKCKCNVGQENTAFHVPNLRDTDETVLSNKTTQAVKWELTEITIAVKKPPMQWSCDVCQVQVSSEKALHQHYAGKKHRSNIATLESRIKAIGDQKVKTAAEPSFGTNQVKTSSGWDCAMCQAKCNSEAHFEHHCMSRKHQQKMKVMVGEGDIAKRDTLESPDKLPSVGSNCKIELLSNGTAHQQNIADSCKEGRKSDVAKNIKPHEANLHESSVPRCAEKPPLVGCDICQVICGRESDLEIHLKGKRHIKKIGALLEESNNNAMNSESPKANLDLDSMPQPVEKTTCGLDLESQLRDVRLMNDRALHEKINQDINNPPEIAKDQIPSSEWDCSMCEAKCSSKAQLEHHCAGRKHQQKVNVTLGEGDIAKVSSLHIEVPCKGGTNSDTVKNVESQEAKSHESNVPKRAEKPPLVGCSICQVMCGRELDLVIHMNGKRHIKKIRALLENSQNKAMDSESQKANLNPASVPQPAEITNYELHLESHLGDERLQLMNDRALGEKLNQDKSNPPELAKDQIPSSEWDCAMCQAKCNSRAQFENHCLSGKHQRKTQRILGQGDIAKTSCLETVDELPSESSNSKNELLSGSSNSKNELPSENMEAQKALNFCEVCDLRCSSSRMLEHHPMGGSTEQSSVQRNDTCSCMHVYGC